MGSLIDNTLCKCTPNISDATAGIVSHTLILLHLSRSEHPPPPEKTKFILKKKLIQYPVSVQKFVNAVAEANIYNLINLNPVGDPNQNYNIISDKLQEKYEKQLPAKKVKYNKHIHKNTKWITAGIMRWIKFRDNLKHRLKTNPVIPYYIKLLNKIIVRITRYYRN